MEENTDPKQAITTDGNVTGVNRKWEDELLDSDAPLENDSQIIEKQAERISELMKELERLTEENDHLAEKNQKLRETNKELISMIAEQTEETYWPDKTENKKPKIFSGQEDPTSTKYAKETKPVTKLSKQHEWTMRIPEKVTGFLIGAKQANKQRMEKKHHVAIKVVSAHDGGDPLFVINGMKPNVNSAIEDIEASIEKAQTRDPPKPQRGRRNRQERKPQEGARYRSRSPHSDPAWHREFPSVWEDETMRGTRHTH